VGVILLLALSLQAGGDLDAVRTLYASLKEKPAAERAAALAGVTPIRTEEAAAFLVDVLAADKDASVRVAALRQLAKNRTPRAVQALVLAARDSKEPVEARIAALEGLTQPPLPEGYAVSKALLRDAGEVRVHAWSGLRRYPLSKETEVLWRMGLGDGDALVRALAMTALAPLKEVALQDLARKVLLEPGEEPVLRYASVAVLREFGGAAGARVLLAGAAAQPDLTLRRLLSEALGALDDKGAAEIYAALKHPDPVVRAVGARALGRLKHAQAGDRLSGPLKDAVVDVRAAALEAVAERKDKNSESILQREAQGSNEDSAALAIALLPAFPSDATRQLLVKLAGHQKLAAAVPALDALGDLGAAEAYPVFEKALKSKDWPIRVSAVRGLRKLRTKEAVDLLVDRMAAEEGRVLADIGDALRSLTGKPFGYGAGQWKEWWTGAREAFAFPDPGASAAGVARAGMTTYHGVPVVSNRMVFCVDISGSMTSPAEGGETRLDQAKKELLKVLGQLGKDAMLNLVFFDDKVEPWQGRLVAIKGALKQAQELVTRLQPRGATNIFDALELALAHKEADTVYLLSDGAPTNGRVIDPDDILREIRRLNRLRKVVVHTVSFGESPFLRLLAEQNGGHYVEIK
jgi:HEAT repeat protein